MLLVSYRASPMLQSRSLLRFIIIVIALKILGLHYSAISCCVLFSRSKTNLDQQLSPTKWVQNSRSPNLSFEGKKKRFVI